MKLWVHAEKTTIEDEHESFIEQEAYSTIPDTYTTWGFGGLYLKDEQEYYDDMYIEIDEVLAACEELHAVIVIYDSGDSFHWDRGYYAEVVSVHPTRENAEKAVALINSYRHEDSNKPILLPDGYEIRHKPWVGYFNNLSEVEVVSGKVLRSEPEKETPSM